MARPSKSVKTMAKNLTKEELAIRLETEEKLRGADDKICPPEYLTDRQKEIFCYIVQELKASGILGNLDVYILSTTAVAIDRIQEIERMVNADPDLLRDSALMRAKNAYTKEFFRCCNELSLSPQSRAKIGNINLQAKQQAEDPLIRVLKGGKK